MKTTVFIFIFDGFSDWEISYLTPELNKQEGIEQIFFSKDGKLVKSMGGLRIIPHYSIDELKASKGDMLVLPGGKIWEKEDNTFLEPIIELFMLLENPIASICGSTVYLANIGLLDNTLHTSNTLHYLKWFANNYKGEANYVNKPALTDKNLITASGTSPIEFANEVVKKLGIYDSADLNNWFQVFKQGMYNAI